jgi:hypothetical protein
MQQQEQYHLSSGAKMITSNAPCSPPKLLYYSSTKKSWSKCSGARWQEQEDGKEISA